MTNTQTGGDGAGQKKYKKTKNDRGDEKRRLNVVCTPVPIPIMIIPAHQALAGPRWAPYGPSAAVAGATWLLLTFAFPLA